MLTEKQAKDKMAQLSGVSLKSWTKYKNLYLFRVQFPMSGEENYDPFFSVDSNTGEISDFSVITDGNLSEIAALTWTNI